MTRNLSSTDRVVRLVAGVVAVAAALLVGVGTSLGVVLLVLAVLLLGTSAVGFCPLYRLLGLSTRSADRAVR